MELDPGNTMDYGAGSREPLRWIQETMELDLGNYEAESREPRSRIKGTMELDSGNFGAGSMKP